MTLMLQNPVVVRKLLGFRRLFHMDVFVVRVIMVLFVGSGP